MSRKPTYEELEQRVKNEKIKFIWFELLILFFSILMIGCASTTSLVNDPNIKSLKTYKNIRVSEWKDSKIPVTKGDTVILIPLYPKGFLYPVKGKIGEKGESFDALDIDIGEIYYAGVSGSLHIGIDQKAQPIRTGVIIFKSDDIETIIEDLTLIKPGLEDAKIINLTLGILHLNKSENLPLNNDSAKALACIEKAIHYFKITDEKLYAITIYRLHKKKATIYKNDGDYDKFNESFNEALDAFMKGTRYYSQFMSKAFSFLDTLTKEERLLLFTKTKFFLKSGTTATTYGDYFGHGFYNLTNAYIFIAMYYGEMGNLRLSLKYSEKAIQEAKLTGNRNLIGWAYFSLGFRHRRFGFHYLAEEALITAKKYYGPFAYSYRYGRWSRVTLKIHLAFNKYLTSKSDSSERELMQFKYFMMRQHPPIHRTTTMIDYMLARIYLDKKEYKKAIKKLESAYPSLKRISKDHFPLVKATQFIDAGLYLCQCYIAVGRLEDAMIALIKIEADIEDLGNPANLKLEVMVIKSKLMDKTGKDSVEPLIRAIASLEEIRPTANSGSDYRYWERLLMVYDEAVDSLYQKKDYFKSLAVAEKARSRRFLDYLGNKKLSAKSQTGYRLSQQANEALVSLSIIENIMLEEAKKAGIKVRTIYQESTRYSKRLENYRSKFREAAEIDQQFGVTYNIVPVSPQKIQKELPDNMTIVEYYLTDKSLYTWVFDQKHIYAVKQDISKENIKNLIIEMRNNITIDTSKRGITVFDGSMQDTTSKYQPLYELFIAPIENHITTHRISIIPYGILNYLPFQAFYDGNKYLIEKYAVSYIPSLSALEFLTKSEKKGSLKILGFGNPDLNDESLDLPATEKEVEMIKDLFPNATILKREEATEATAKRLARQYDIIHFASHGEYIPEEPLASCIRLSSGHGEDGRLEADEIFDMDINADLVVTSACQTAVGQIGKGDEIVGLTRAFIYAGANSVLGSLWNISDEATAVLMKEFYSNITAFDKVESLRQAQIKMIQSSEYSHPFYWAAFNITGGF